MEKELKKLYNSEINVRIDCFWDGGWRVVLGDEMNGYKYPDFDNCELHEVVPTIRELAQLHYPNSKYVYNMRPWYQRIFKPFTSNPPEQDAL